MALDAKELATAVEWRYERFYAFVTRLRGRWRMHTNRRTAMIALLLTCFFLGMYWFTVRPPSDFPVGKLITIPDGQNLASIAQILQDQHVIRSALAFRVIVKALHEDRQLHAGDYLFKTPLSVFSIANRVALGTYGLEPTRFLIPDGATTAEMARIFAPKLQRFNAPDFLAKARPMEGYLFPDTYFFLPNASADMVIAAMRKNFDAHIAAIEPAIASSTHPLSDVIIMASIVEREARNMKDRSMIAGVLWRRLKLGMPLQSDATFLYTIGKGSFQLTMSDLQSTSSYNTYTHKGLPPTPIGSPSMDAIEAALNPIDDGYLYYMADNNGVTHYCKTFACQKQNEILYLGK